MANKQPWLVEGSPWKTESAFWVWVRGVLRKGWNVHPIKLIFINKFRKRIVNPVEKNRKRFPECWGMTCSICDVDTPQKDIQIDHKGDSHSFTGLHDAESYMKHLFLIDFSSIRALCTSCHKVVNYAQSKNISFEESLIEKRILETIKDKKTTLAILQQHGYNNCTNDEKRKAALREIFQKEK